MEHRMSIRRPLQLAAELWRENSSFAKGLLSNVGDFGFFLEVDTRAIETGDFFTLKIAPNSDSGETTNIKTVVVHKSPYGVGLMKVDNNIVFMKPTYTQFKTTMQHA